MCGVCLDFLSLISALFEQWKQYTSSCTKTLFSKPIHGAVHSTMSSLGMNYVLRSFPRSVSHAAKSRFNDGTSRYSARSDAICSIRCRGLATASMDLLKELRTLSGAPIVDCKKALQNSDDNINAAMDWLREHGAAKTSSKVQGRVTTEGLVAIKVSDDGKSASIVRVSSETDFAGRSAKFVDFVMNVAHATLETNDVGKLDSTSVLASQYNGKTVKDMLDEAIVAIRENISVADAIKLDSKDGIFVGYVHNKINSSDAGTSAAIVEIAPIEGNMNASTETLQMAGKKLAMHIVAARPQYLAPTDVPVDEVRKEKDILMKQLLSDDDDAANAKNKKKSPEMLEKIVEGKLRKFYEIVCLTEQSHMIEEKNPKVGKVLSNLDVTVNNFTTLSIS